MHKFQNIRHISRSYYSSLPKRTFRHPHPALTPVRKESLDTHHVKRNELGIQLLSSQLHAQVFKNAHFPSPPPSYIQISKDHLKLHGLDPTQCSTLPDTSFVLPELQGNNISQHFHRLGTHAAEPWMRLSKEFASTSLPPRPKEWRPQSGWTKYTYDGLKDLHIPQKVGFPQHNAQPEQMLAFDVETMPPHHPYPVIACAASPHAWYVWISPWLLGETDDPKHLVLLGSCPMGRIVVGHNVSYDRARVADEYSLQGTSNRFIDTMSLHVAVSGISSHQRPAWTKYRKAKAREEAAQRMALEGTTNVPEAQDPFDRSCDGGLDATIEQMKREIAADFPFLEDETSDLAEAEATAKRWEDITSANSLADVARLHCGVEVNKEVRNDLMELGRDQIKDNIARYLEYCSTDVDITHQVYRVVHRSFLESCPHPVSFAGILTMGSSFLTVNTEWKRYIDRAETMYRDMERRVLDRLKALAEDAFALADTEAWRSDPWLSQLDWSPKVAKRSRGVETPQPVRNSESNPVPCVDFQFQDTDIPDPQHLKPLWYLQVTSSPFSRSNLDRILPLLLRLSYMGHPILYNTANRWHYVVEGQVHHIELSKGKKTTRILSKASAKLLDNHTLTTPSPDLAYLLCAGNQDDNTRNAIFLLANALSAVDRVTSQNDSWLSQLDWSMHPPSDASPDDVLYKKPKKVVPPKPPPVLWPKWYWEATKPKKDTPPGTLDITVRSRIAPILLRLSWNEWPLFYSTEHGWTYRVPISKTISSRAPPLTFHDPADERLADATLGGKYIFYKLPHKDGEKANVGSPLSKSFVKYAQNGTLRSPGDEAKEALEMNALCSYWISSRDRIMNQMVVWQEESNRLGFPPDGERWGLIIPQVVTMGTVTRRAIEKTWLTASNAKKNRLGSELKSMVRAPDGYAIVGADVDSEELWISSCMGDAQFGDHGSSAIGWMTLEGTKAAGTDLHSKTASILGISRDQAKVFNYSRIYGAGMRHAIILLLQSNPNMRPEEAQKLAESLYASTKGKNTHRTDIFGRKFWYGGTESFLFNKLEEIATSDTPQTPALGCRVTNALSKEYLPEGFGSDYMPSRINWVVQSSGVDYLHLLIVSMTYLIEKYEIKARYLISVHDEVRYLVSEEDKYRAALALQVANLWTRCLFAFSLGMGDLPQGVAFFSAVDIDKVLRKEVDMPCVTPSQPDPILPGESLDIQGILNKTNGGSLKKGGQPMVPENRTRHVGTMDGYIEHQAMTHRAPSAAFLQAQASTDFGEVRGLAQQEQDKYFEEHRRPSTPRTKR